MCVPNPTQLTACRYYNLGVWMAVLDHNENVDRHVRGERWVRGESLRHDGRWYKKKVRDPPTDAWRKELWEQMLADAKGVHAGDQALEVASHAYVTDSVDASRERAVRDALDDVILSVVAAAASPANGWRSSSWTVMTQR